jgi:hypothetical protein
MASTLTRHFYALDEVTAALQYACIHGRSHEACFWLQELIDSGEAAFAIKAMTEAYILNCGVMRLGWLKAAYDAFSAEEVTEEALYAACISLCRIIVRDYSLIGLHLVRFIDSGPATQEDFIKGIKKGNARAAFWAAGALDGDWLIMTMSQHASKPLDYLIDLNTWAGTTFAPHTLLCLCIMTCCLQPDEVAAVYNTPVVSISATLEEERLHWAALIGRRLRRMYTIPNGCFYLITRRGRMPWSESTESELLRVGDQRTTVPYLRDCEYWNDMIDECSEGCIDDDGYWSHDESWEQFTNKTFIDDIPDEWSAEERLRSHGPGKCGQATACANVRKWLTYNVSITDMGAITFRESRFMDGCVADIAKKALSYIDIDRYVPVEENWSAAFWLGTLWNEGDVADMTNMLSAVSIGSGTKNSTN